MTNPRTHTAQIADAEPAPRGAECAAWHADNDGYLIGIEAEVRLILATPIGLRYVDLCDQHDEMTGDELVPWSEALDPAQAQLENEVCMASLAARIRG